MRFLLILWLVAVTVALVLRFTLAHVLISFTLGDSLRGYPIHHYAFWLVLVIAGLITLVKLVRAR